jgi:hypothetical protein
LRGCARGWTTGSWARLYLEDNKQMAFKTKLDGGPNEVHRRASRSVSAHLVELIFAASDWQPGTDGIRFVHLPLVKY